MPHEVFVDWSDNQIIVGPLCKKVFEMLGIWRFLARLPIAILRLVPKKVFANKPRYKTSWKHAAKEHDTEYETGHDEVQAEG